MVYEKGWVAMNDGNLSIRLDSERILCTPTAVSKGLVEADDLIVCDMSGNRLEGQRECTSEIAMHTTIYEMRPDVRSVVHAHPPVATGFATAGRALDKALLPEVIIQLGAVPLASYGLPGTPAITDPMIPLIPHYDALLLENHGCTTYGPDVWTKAKTGRVLFGSDYPLILFPQTETAPGAGGLLGEARQAGATVAVLGGNAARLFGW